MKIGGTFYLKKDGKIIATNDSEWSYSLGRELREEKLGQSGVLGFTTKVQAPYCEGTVVLTPETDVESILNTEDSTVVLELPGKTFILHSAFFASDGKINTSGDLEAKFIGKLAEIIKD
tara:strand:- start:1538 stop:1894 length:357 start_codon:yes stop_codon:yes gene_type:complete